MTGSARRRDKRATRAPRAVLSSCSPIGTILAMGLPWLVTTTLRPSRTRRRSLEKLRFASAAETASSIFYSLCSDIHYYRRRTSRQQVASADGRTRLHVAKVIDDARHASAWGVSFQDPGIDVDRLRAFKQRVVDKLTGGVGQVARLRKVNFVQGRATLQGPRALTVAGANGRTQLRFEHAILATGSRPTRIPSLSHDSSRMMDSTAALDLPDVPASLLVVGAGYIGLELGSVYATLGSRVSVVEMMPGLLPGADRDLVSVLHKRLERSSSRSRGGVLNFHPTRRLTALAV